MHRNGERWEAGESPSDWSGLDPAFPVEVTFCSGPPRGIPGTAARCEIWFVQAGGLRLRIGERIARAGPGDLVVLGRRPLQRISRAGRAPVQIVQLRFLPELLHIGEAGAESFEYLAPLLDQEGSFPQVIAGSTGLPAEAVRLLEKIQGELPPRSARARLSVKTYLKMILVLLGNHYERHLTAQRTLRLRQRDQARLEPLLSFLNHNYRRPLTVGQAASMLRMSRSHFMRFFRRATGEPLISYLNRLRIARAEALLASGGRTISQVSQEVGFCDQSYFGYVFRKVRHMTPREYKRMHGGAASVSAAPPPGPRRNAVAPLNL